MTPPNRPVIYARNKSKSIINSSVTVAGKIFRTSLRPGEVSMIPWPIATSVGFQRAWGRGQLEVSLDYKGTRKIDELPELVSGEGGFTFTEEPPGSGLYRIP